MLILRSQCYPSISLLLAPSYHTPLLLDKLTPTSHRPPSLLSPPTSSPVQMSGGLAKSTSWWELGSKTWRAPDPLQQLEDRNARLMREAEERRIKEVRHRAIRVRFLFSSLLSLFAGVGILECGIGVGG